MNPADVLALSYSSRQGRWVLTVTMLGSGIASLDATVVNIALPTIGRDFHAGIAALQWVVTGYTLTLAAFLLIGRSLGDWFGRRKVYLIGIVWFAVASVACGFAPDAVFLIVTRVLQGVGAALLTPGSLAILEASFVPRRPGPGDRGLVGPERRGRCRRPAGRRLSDLGRFMVVDFLHQRPDRGGGGRARHAARPRVAGPQCDRLDRLRRRGSCDGVPHGCHVRVHRGAGAGWSSPAVLTMTLTGVVGLAAFLVVSTPRPRRCCRCRSSPSVSSPRLTP
jgi:hypothetical protein